MQLFDIAIIGAGPAGCSASLFLDEEFKTILIDRNRFPRKKPCGGIFIEESDEFLKNNFNVPESIFSKPKTLNLLYEDWDNDKKVKQKRNFGNVNRFLFDKWLYDLVKEKNNIEISTLTKVVDLKKEDDSFILNIEKNDKKEVIKTKMVVDATGSYSFVRRRNKQNIPFYLAIQYSVDVELSDKDSFRFILSDSITDYYSWIIAKGDKTVIGSALSRNDKITKQIQLFKNKINEKFGIDNFEKTESAMIVRPRCPEDICLSQDGCFILGESAGLISSSTGEGMSYALISGKNCADSINEYDNLNNTLLSYQNKSKPLIDDVIKKIEMSKIFSDKNKRLKFFTTFASN